MQAKQGKKKLPWWAKLLMVLLAAVIVFGFLHFAGRESNRSQMQYAGGILLTPVQTLAASPIPDHMGSIPVRGIK